MYRYAIILSIGFVSLVAVVFAAGNIDTQGLSYHWAWNDIIGWINFKANSSVEVRVNELRGWAMSNMGAIVFNCQTSPVGDICSGSDFKVVNNSGVLSGWAWNDVIGWISFGGSNYGVTIQPSGDGINSFFKGWAWNDAVGWLSMHCENQGLCLTFPTYRIQTGIGSQSAGGVLESNVFDTGSSDPSYNYILWRGIPKTGGSVQFQVASSDSVNGPWNFDLSVTAAVGQIHCIL